MIVSLQRCDDVKECSLRVGSIACQLHDDRPQRCRDVFEKSAGCISLTGEDSIDERMFEVAAQWRHNLHLGRDRPFGGRIVTDGIVVAWLGLFRDQQTLDQQAARPHDFSPDKQSTRRTTVEQPETAAFPSWPFLSPNNWFCP
jgi:hypothetical protein